MSDGHDPAGSDNPSRKVLPPEIWAEIFQHTLCDSQGPQLYNVYPDILVKAGPVTITQVCSRWRSIAISSGKLWSFFRIIVKESGLAPHLLEILLMWITRAGNCPLHFYIEFRPTYNFRRWISPIADPKALSALNAVLGHLMPHVARWQDAALHVPEPIMHQLKLHSSCALRSLSLQTIGITAWPSILPRWAIFPNDVELAHLKDLSLDVDGILLEDCFHILEMAFQLRSCSIRAECTVLDSRAEYPRIRHINLRSLNLRLTRRQSVLLPNSISLLPPPFVPFTKFLNTLDLPNLHTLDLHWLMDCEDPGKHASCSAELTNFFSRSSLSLRSLRLSNLLCDDRQLLECLEMLPFLTSIDLRCPLSSHDDPITDSILRRLQVNHATASPLIPRLESLRVQCYGNAFAEPSFIQLINSRRQLPSHQRERALRELKLYTCVPPPNALMDEVQRWAQHGLDVYLNYFQTA